MSSARTRVQCAVVVLGLVGPACRGAELPARDERAPTTEPPGPEPPRHDPQPAPAPAPAPNSFEPLSPAERASEQEALRMYIEQAHAARDAHDTTAAVTAFQHALAINPMHAPTGGELARALVANHALESAALVLTSAVHHAKDKQIRAALLGELGQVTQALGDVASASEHYTNSLASHPDPIIAARLATMTNGMEVISHNACGWVERGPAPAELCPAYLRAIQTGQASRVCAYDPGNRHDLEFDAATKVRVFSYDDEAREAEVFVLNAIIDGIWHTTELTWVSHPPVRHADESLADLELRTEQLAPGGLPELVIEWSVHGRATDLLDNREQAWSAKRLGVLMLQSGTPRWLIGVTRESTYTSDVIDGAPSDPRVRTIGIEWLTKTGEIELRRTEYDPSAPIGRFALGAAPQLCPAELESD